MLAKIKFRRQIFKNLCIDAVGDRYTLRAMAEELMNWGMRKVADAFSQKNYFPIGGDDSFANDLREFDSSGNVAGSEAVKSSSRGLTMAKICARRAVHPQRLSRTAIGPLIGKMSQVSALEKFESLPAESADEVTIADTENISPAAASGVKMGTSLSFFKDTLTHVKPYYQKRLPAYEDVHVLWDGKIVLFCQLNPEIQLQLLREGIRGNGRWRMLQTIAQILAKPETQRDQRQLTQLMKSALGVHPGSISRVHSIVHAARAAVFAEIFADVYRRLFTEFENLSDREVAQATIAALFHDSGREAEGIDVFEGLSAKNAADYLLQCGFSSAEAEEIRELILHKDDPVTDKKLVNILLHEADCMEYARLLGFNKRYLDVFGGTGKSDQIRFTPRDGVSIENASAILNRIVEAAKVIIHQPYSSADFTAEDYATLRAKTIERINQCFSDGK